MDGGFVAAPITPWFIWCLAQSAGYLEGKIRIEIHGDEQKDAMACKRRMAKKVIERTGLVADCPHVTGIDYNCGAFFDLAIPTQLKEEDGEVVHLFIGKNAKLITRTPQSRKTRGCTFAPKEMRILISSPCIL